MRRRGSLTLRLDAAALAGWAGRRPRVLDGTGLEVIAKCVLFGVATETARMRSARWASASNMARWSG